MPYQTDTITINGSANVFGGTVFSANYSQGYNGTPSDLVLSIVSENRQYQIPSLSFASKYCIKLGNNITFNLYAYKYCIDDGDSGRILRVSFMDDVVKLRRYWVDLNSLFAAKNMTQNNGTSKTVDRITIPNVIPLGKTAEEVSKKNLPANLFDNYTYKEFQAATAFLGIPSFPSNDYMVTNMRGTVLDVFNYFCEAYGYSWYFDMQGNIKLLDIKRPVQINPATLNALENHTKRLNSQLCTDISQNDARGTLAIENGNSEVLVIAGALPFWEGNFLKIPFKIRDLNECIAATLGQEIFFYYVASQRGWQEACLALGFRVKEIIPLSDKRAATIKAKLESDPTSIYHYSGSSSAQAGQSGAPNENLGIVVYEPFENTEQVEFNIAVKIGELLKQKYYYVLSAFPDLDINWNVGSAQLLDRDATIAEAIDFWDVLDFSQVRSMALAGGGFKDPRLVRLRDIAPSDVWTIILNPDEAPNKPDVYVRPVFSGTLSITDTPPGLVGIGNSVKPFSATVGSLIPDMIKLNTSTYDREHFVNYNTQKSEAQQRAMQDAIVKSMSLFPQNYEEAATLVDTKYAGSTYRIMIINATEFKNISLPLPDYSALKKDIKGTGSYKNAGTNDLYNTSNKVITAKTDPVVTDKTASISLETYENPTDGTIDTKAFLQQAAFNRSQDDKQYQCEIRGISLGFSIGPEDGLTEVRVDFSENGYRTMYGLSTRQAKPAALETFRQKFAVN